MTASLQKVMQQVEKLARERIASRPVRNAIDWSKDPVGYIQTVLKKRPWAVQEEICRKLLEPPYRVLVRAGHSVGKSFISACLTSWWFDTFPNSCVITTAPTARDVRDILWREVRLLRGKLGGFRGDSAPELWAGPNRFAKGFTASKGESFVGRHLHRMLFIFDEATGVEPIFWEGAETMFQPNGLHAWLAIFNPTDASSQAAFEDRKGGWTTITMSCLDHPNIAAELAGQAAEFPAAVSLAQVEGWLKKWAERIDPSERKVTDFEFPPGSGIIYRPGPLCECRVLGRWPSQAACSVWSDSLWQSVLATRHEIQPHWKVQIGVDVARFGDDFTAIHVRQGMCSLHHETHNGWSTDKTAGRLKQLCHQYQTERQPSRAIPCLIDSTGVGGGVVDQASGFSFVGIDSAEKAIQEDTYLNTRSELWFGAAECAKAGLLDVSRLPTDVQQELGRQLMAPTYEVDNAGRLRVEEKATTKKRIKSSPDSADAWNLAWKVYGGQEKVSGAIG